MLKSVSGDNRPVNFDRKYIIDRYILKCLKEICYKAENLNLIDLENVVSIYKILRKSEFNRNFLKQIFDQRIASKNFNDSLQSSLLFYSLRKFLIAGEYNKCSEIWEFRSVLNILGFNPKGGLSLREFKNRLMLRGDVICTHLRHVILLNTHSKGFISLNLLNLINRLEFDEGIEYNSPDLTIHHNKLRKSPRLWNIHSSFYSRNPKLLRNNICRRSFSKSYSKVPIVKETAMKKKKTEMIYSKVLAKRKTKPVPLKTSQTSNKNVFANKRKSKQSIGTPSQSKSKFECKSELKKPIKSKVYLKNSSIMTQKKSPELEEINLFDISEVQYSNDFEVDDVFDIESDLEKSTIIDIEEVEIPSDIKDMVESNVVTNKLLSQEAINYDFKEPFFSALCCELEQRNGIADANVASCSFTKANNYFIESDRVECIAYNEPTINESQMIESSGCFNAICKEVEIYATPKEEVRELSQFGDMKVKGSESSVKGTKRVTFNEFIHICDSDEQSQKSSHAPSKFVQINNKEENAIWRKEVKNLDRIKQKNFLNAVIPTNDTQSLEIHAVFDSSPKCITDFGEYFDIRFKSISRNILAMNDRKLRKHLSSASKKVDCTIQDKCISFEDYSTAPFESDVSTCNIETQRQDSILKAVLLENWNHKPASLESSSLSFADSMSSCEEELYSFSDNGDDDNGDLSTRQNKTKPSLITGLMGYFRASAL